MQVMKGLTGQESWDLYSDTQKLPALLSSYLQHRVSSSIVCPPQVTSPPIDPHLSRKINK